MAFGYLGWMKTKPGHRDDVVAILTRNQDRFREIGCRLYVIGLDPEDPDKFWINEIWESDDLRTASLLLPDTEAVIDEMLPMMTEEFGDQKFEIAGGFGVSGDPASTR